MLYLDSNVFIYATINTQALGEKARALLQKIQQGEEKAETSALTFDEVFWAVKKHSQEAAVEACQALLNFPNLEIVPVDRELILQALRLIEEHRLAPQDAIHAATAIADKADIIVSADAHFDKLKEPKRQSLETLIL
jgi:predicted nucleic acid-binding protein